jgi:D-alanyl-lipoteichoic acid acyltransferase DltB (MBOAT superfamily)
MDIKSIYFVLFLPLVVILYYLVPQRFKWTVLLFSSLFFVAFNSITSLLVLSSAIILNYFSAQQINNISNYKKKQYFLWLIIVLNLILLGIFKYYNVFNRGGSFFSNLLGSENPIPHIEWLLPLGISYYIFQSIGYNIEIYRENEVPEKHFGNFAVYLSFFPKLIAGPIEKSVDFLPQLKKKVTLKYENISHGGRLILWGTFKKMVVAEFINEFTEQIFSNPTEYSGLPLIVGFLLYTVEIYADFSGYTDIALGSARLFGINLTQNFNKPFFSTSLTDFWRRWHISLSTWVNNYIFTPLSMWISITFPFKKWGIIFSVFFSFLLLGIWHGSDINFALFGAIQGAILGCEILTTKIRKRLSESIPTIIYKALSTGLTLLVFAFSCIFFKANNLPDAKHWIKESFHFNLDFSFFSSQDFLIAITAILLFIFVDHQIFKNGFDKWCSSKNGVFRWLVYAVIIFSIIVLSGVNTYPFIYSNF